MTGEIKSDILYTKENNVYIKAKGRRKMKLGFIGAGNMAKAMMGGILKNGILTAEEVIASDMYVPGLEKTKEELGIHVTTDNKEVATKAEIIVMQNRQRNC